MLTNRKNKNSFFFLNNLTNAEHLCSKKIESPLVTGQK